MRKLLAATAIGGALLSGVLATAGTANAFPGLGYCPGGGGGFGSFGYCDGPTYPDGSYDHTVAAMAISPMPSATRSARSPPPRSGSAGATAK